MSVAFIALSILWLGLIAYAVLGGADDRQRAGVDRRQRDTVDPRLAARVARW